MMNNYQTENLTLMTNSNRIIVVEDDFDFRDSIVEYLTLSGFDVTGVGSAMEFYRTIAEQNFNLTILDIGLPDQSGLVLAEYVRNNTDMRIVMLTAQYAQESRITAYRAGADIYLVKPVDLSELLASIQSILGRLDSKKTRKPEIINAEPSPEKEQKKWCLEKNDWTLCSPAGNIMKLTAKEFDLIEALALRHNSTVKRQNLLTALDYENSDFGNRALDALVHRLRRKYEELNIKIPIKTIHGSGYCFSAPVLIT